MQPGGDEMKAIALEIQRLIDQEESGVLILVVRAVGSTPGKVGSKMVVLPDGSIRGSVGAGVVEARVIADSLNALEDGRGPRTLHYKLEELGVGGGGEMSIYLEPMVAPRRVILYGAGHVAAAIARHLKMLGCRVTVVDEREDWANRERFPDVEAIVNRPFADAITGAPPGPRDHVIIATRGQEKDQQVLELVLAKKFAYLGVVGSTRKAVRAIELLRAKGIAEELVAQLRIPMGLDIGAVNPEEIAVSAAAELVLFWRRGAVALEVVAPRAAVRAAKPAAPAALGAPGVRPAPPALPATKGKEVSLEELLFDDAEEKP
jgi:xanthine dehydrogenase accessory factor